MILVAVALTPCFFTYWAWALPVEAVSAHRNEFWMNELVLDLRNGHVWQTRVKLSISSFRRYSSLISILSGTDCPPGVVAGRIGKVPNMSVGAKK